MTVSSYDSEKHPNDEINMLFRVFTTMPFTEVTQVGSILNCSRNLYRLWEV